jgi:transposase-like protein
MSYEEFVHLFPSDDACLAYLKDRYYPDGTACPRCRRASRFRRIRGRSAFSCQFCGTHVYPTAGTIFHKSTTSLRLWFWAVFLLASTRFQISHRQLERELGVSYATARRMLERITAALEGVSIGPAPTAPAWQARRRRS